MDVCDNRIRYEFDTHDERTVIGKGRMKDACVIYTEYSDHTIVIDGYGRLLFNLRDYQGDTCGKYSTNVVVVGNFDVVGFRAFFDWISLNTIRLPYSIRKIESDAFSDCDNLKVIYMPGNISMIHENAFVYTEPEKIVFYDDCSVNPSILQYFHEKVIPVEHCGRII